MRKKIFTIPNVLSSFRIILALAYLALFRGQEILNKQEILAGILILSAVTDFLDGRIARRFNMVSDLGKLLDPMADKLTQGVLLICLLMRYETAKYVLVLFLAKEICMGIAGLDTIRVTGKNEGAMWYGKLSTAVFYGVTIVLSLFPGIPQNVGEIMLLCSGFFMLLSFVLYSRHYYELRKGLQSFVSV